ncbi:hypothetical protein T01_12191 [Trichinella spiralis]|uniref:Uncharacterized protein n=1 Tax=Trichinella spiralis TaxID=6334 RepID=A0A0V0YRW9_TRISP|nr:hypothetical protein T01_12191 [Trichinella spiralis]
MTNICNLICRLGPIIKESSRNSGRRRRRIIFCNLELVDAISTAGMKIQNPKNDIVPEFHGTFTLIQRLSSCPRVIGKKYADR